MSRYATRSSCLALGLLAACATQGPGTELPTHRVQRGDLRIEVREQGELQAAEHARVASQVEGLARLIYLIPEGSIVEQGDRLAELDVSGAEDKRASQAIAVAKAEATLEQAKKSFQIMENTLAASREAAEGALTVAQIRQERFIGRSVPSRPEGSVVGTNAEVVSKLRELVQDEEDRDPNAEYRYADLVETFVGVIEGNLQIRAGEMANRVLRQMDAVALAWESLQLAADRLANVRSLYEAGRSNEDQVRDSELAYRTQLSEHTLAWNDLDLLVRFTLVEDKVRLTQDVKNAQLNLESVVAQNEARRVDESVELRSKEAEFQLAQERLQHLTQQIENAVIRAPTPGLVVYANQGTGAGRQPLQTGMEVHEHQPLINLPDVTRVIAEFKVREDQVDLVAVSQPATVRVNAYPERVYTGTVVHVSSLPDSSSRFTNADIKVYKVSVALDMENTDGALRPGMNAEVEIPVEVVPDVLTVPLIAVRRREETAYVWRLGPDGPEEVVVTLGKSDGEAVEVRSGLREGDEVLLGTPGSGG